MPAQRVIVVVKIVVIVIVVIVIIVILVAIIMIIVEGELRGSQAMGVASNNWFDRGLPSILYMFKPSPSTDVQTPFLETPFVPFNYCYYYYYYYSY